MFNSAKNFVIPLILGFATFFLIVGYEVLVIDNIDWLKYGDPSTYFIGWNFFRFSEWTLPLGLNPKYGNISLNSIIYSDSNALLAIFFKAFTNYLPSKFQYFGIWILLCFLMQAFFSWKLLSLVCKNIQIRSLGVVLFIFSPTFLWRLEPHVMHLMLLAHFLILASLYLAFIYKEKEVVDYFRWGLLLAVSILIQAYIFFICFCIFLAVFVSKINGMHNIKKFEFFKLFNVLFIILFFAWISGYFVVLSDISANGFGFYKMNLLALIDPAMNNYKSWSYILPNVPGENDQHEGFNYLGFGLILFSFVSINIFFRNKAEILGDLYKYKFIFYALIFFTFYALSNVIHIGSFKFLKIPLPDPILNLLNVFRSSGRVFWPVFYTIILFNIYLLAKYVNQKKAIFLMYLFVCIQVVDTSSGWIGIKKNLNNKTSSWSDTLNDKFWQDASKRYKNLIYIKPGLPEKWENLSYFASQNSMSTNIAYVIRYNKKKYDSFYKDLDGKILKKDFSSDTLYILDLETFNRLNNFVMTQKSCNKDLIAYINDVYVLAPKFNNSGCPVFVSFIPK